MTKRQQMAQALRTKLSADHDYYMPMSIAIALVDAQLECLTSRPTPVMVAAGEAVIQKLIGHDAQIATEVFHDMVEAMIAEGK